MKKLSVILLGILLCICLALLPMETQAATEGYLTYTITDGEVTITDCDEGATGKIVIPDTIEGYPVTKIGESAFTLCVKITEIALPDGLKSIGASAFSYVPFESIYIPKTVTQIDKAAFWRCEELKEIVIPEGVTVLSDQMFYECKKLKKVTLPESLIEIGVRAFERCDELEIVNIPVGLQKLGSDAFAECPGLTMSVVIPEGVTEIEGGVFYCTGIKEVVLHDGITKIGGGAFYGCDIEEIYISDSVSSIGSSAFYGCRYLTSIYIPDGITTIESNTFLWCHSLESVRLPKGLESIGQYAFGGCSSLREINFPESLSTIGREAFMSCSSLPELVISKNLSSIGDGAFKACKNLKSIIVDPENAYFSVDDHQVIYNKDKTVLLQAPSHLTGIYVIPEGVQSIGDDAFRYCKELTQVQFPSTVTEIGSYAFASCEGLTELWLPEGVTKISRGAFEDCINLVNVHLPDSLTSIGDSAFHRCDAIVEISIPKNVQGLSQATFLWCKKLERVYLRTGIKYFEQNVFSMSDNLKEIIYCGTPGDWERVKIAANNEELEKITIIFHTEFNRTLKENPTCGTNGSESYRCEVCGESGLLPIPATGEHNILETWSGDNAYHWHGCSNCDLKMDMQSHIPGPAATEDAPQTCTVCGYEIAPKLEKEDPIYWVWVVVGAIVVAGGATAAVIILKKKRQ